VVVTPPETGNLRPIMLSASSPEELGRTSRDSLLCRRIIKCARSVIRLDAMILPTIAKASCVPVIIPACVDMDIGLACES
jgi:hypothetical protein